MKKNKKNKNQKVLVPHTDSGWALHCKLKEDDMGISMSEFQKRKKALLTDYQLLARAEANRQFVQDWIAKDRPIYTMRYKRDNYKELKLRNDEYFVPCFNVYLDGNNELPITWFVSNYRHLISIVKDRVVWVQVNYKSDDYKHERGFYMIDKDNITGRTKKITAYTLMALVFRNKDTFFGKAEEYLNLFGLYAFGGKKDAFNLNGHHPLRTGEYPECIYDSTNLQIMTIYAHDMLHALRYYKERVAKNPNAPGLDKEEAILADQLYAVLEYEAPERDITVDIDGKYMFTVLD